MSPRPVLSPEERDLVLSEARRDDSGTRIPIRTPALGTAIPPSGSTRNPAGGAGGMKPTGAFKGGPPASPIPLQRFPPRRRRRRTIMVVVGLLLVIFLLTAGKLLSVGSSVLSSERSILGQLTDLLFRRGALQGEKDNRVNVLLAAIGGEGHQGENLADTIILASFRPKENDVALLSIPRDLYVKLPDTEVTMKINAVHAHGEQQRGQGLPLLRRKISEITGQPVHYVARVDFLAFKRIVDEIGGVEIVIHEGFIDYWHRINFPQGTEHMNGDRALAYVRARFIEGPEGGDFKRAERTQQVLLAIRKKVLSAQTAFDLRALAGVLDALRDNVETNFTLAELKRLIELTRGIEDGNIRSSVLTTGKDGLLVGSTEVLGGRPASVLRPRAGLEEYREIQAFAADIFAKAGSAPPPAAGGTSSSEASPAASPSTARTDASPEPTTVAAEQPTVEIRNGTNVTGLAARVSKALAKSDFTVMAVGNAAIRNRSETIVVDRTGGKKPNSLQALLDALGITTAVSFPEAEKAPADASFVIFVGADVAEKFKP